MNEKEKEALSGSICRFIHELVQQADEFNIDRDSYIKAAADLLCVMSSVSTFKHFDVEKKRYMRAERLESGQAYWLYAEQDCAIQVTGAPLGTPLATE